MTDVDVVYLVSKAVVVTVEMVMQPLIPPRLFTAWLGLGASVKLCWISDRLCSPGGGGGLHCAGAFTVVVLVAVVVRMLVLVTIRVLVSVWVTVTLLVVVRVVVSVWVWVTLLVVVRVVVAVEVTVVLLVVKRVLVAVTTVLLVVVRVTVVEPVEV